MAQTTPTGRSGDNTETPSVSPGSGSGTPRQNPVSPNDAGPTVSPSGELVGYARTSTREQSTLRQVEAFRELGIPDRFIFEDHGYSGALRMGERPAQQRMLDMLRPGDTIVVVELSRLGRRAAELIGFLDDLNERGCSLRILNLGVDTQTITGKLVVSVVAALAECELETTRERIRAGIEASRKNGKKGGRPRVLSDEQVEAVVSLASAGRHYREISRLFNVSERTVRRHIKAATEGTPE